MQEGQALDRGWAGGEGSWQLHPCVSFGATVSFFFFQKMLHPKPSNPPDESFPQGSVGQLFAESFP